MSAYRTFERFTSQSRYWNNQMRGPDRPGMSVKTDVPVFISGETIMKTISRKAVFKAAFILCALWTAFSGKVFADTYVSAAISGEQVTVNISADELSDDGIYYLYAQYPFEEGASGEKIAEGSSTSFSFVFTTEYLYKKFSVLTLQNGVLTEIGSSYITNPESIAEHTAERMDGGIKGILPDLSVLSDGYMEDLEIDQTTCNAYLGRIVSGTGITYEYDGRVYSFDETAVAELDAAIFLLSSHGIQVTVILLNDMAENTVLIHSLSLDGTEAEGYAFNTETEAGIKTLAAVTSFLAERYGNESLYGQVDNWIVGNEVNAYGTWSYMDSEDVSSYTKDYAEAFRIVYNAVKSQNANANVYISLDNEWTVSAKGSVFAGKDVLSWFNHYISFEGNIDWRVAFHPYNTPLSKVETWEESSLVLHDEDSPYITMLNIDVLTDFLSQDEFLSPSGDVRSVKISEVGYTSSDGEALQAAAVVFAYMQALNNRYIDGLILNRQTNAAEEVKNGLYLGLMTLSGKTKLAYDYYKHANEQNYQKAASSLAGVSLEELITVR